MEWLVEPKRSRVASFLVYCAGALQVIGAAALLLGSASVSELVLAGLLVLAGGLFLSVARLLGARKGGLGLTPRGEELVLFGVDHTDALAVPASELAAVAQVDRREFWGNQSQPVTVHSVHVLRTRPACLFVMDLPTPEDSGEIAASLRRALRLPVLKDGAAPPGPRPELHPLPAGLEPRMEGMTESFRLATGARFALWLPMLLTGLLSLISGSVVLSTVATTGVVGFLFGPVLAALGFCLLAVFVSNAVGHEELSVRGTLVLHASRLGSFAWSRRELRVSSEPLVARVRTRGALGFCLELASGPEMIIVGAGSTCRSQLPPSALLALADYVARTVNTRLSDGTQPSRPALQGGPK
jgi:hypothetical protein